MKQSMRRITAFIAGWGFAYGTFKFSALTYTLLAAGQFFTPILAMAFAAACAVIGIAFFMEAVS